MHFLEDFSNSLSSASIVLCQRCYCCAKGAIQGYCCAKGAIAVPKVLVKGIAVPKVLLLCQRCYCCAKDAIAVPKVLLLCQRCYSRMNMCLCLILCGQLQVYALTLTTLHLARTTLSGYETPYKCTYSL